MENNLNAETTALLFFDLLNGHVKKDDPDTKARYEPVIKNAVALMEKARSLDMTIAYAAANHRSDNRTTAQTIRDTDNKMNRIKPGNEERLIHGGSWEAQVIDEIAPRAEDFRVPKYRWSAFHQTCLELVLRVNRIDTIVISGGSTDVGVASTAFSARDMDYNIVFASDACTSHQMKSHEYLMGNIFPRMGRVRSTAQIIEMLGV